MAPLMLLALIACTLCAAIGLAMTVLVLWQAPRERENQLLVAYFLLASYGVFNVVIARLLSLVGADATFFFYESYNGSTLAFVALLALATHTAGLWQRRWVPWAVGGLGALALFVHAPLLHRGVLIEFQGYDGTGQLHMGMTSLGQVVFLSVYPIGLVSILVALSTRDSRKIVPGISIAVIGAILHATVPFLRPYPVTVTSVAVSMILLARVILREKLFDPLARLNRELEAELRGRGELIAELRAFADTVAHDLKGPLGPIVGAAQLLEEEGEDLGAEGRRDFAAMIGRNAAAMSRIIDSLLLLATVRQGEVDPRPVDMGAIVAAVRERLAPEIAASAARFELPDSWPAAVGYAPWLEEVWANYAGNAIKYGGRPPLVRIEARRDGDACEFSVIDNGDGLTAEQMQKLFRPLTRLPGSKGDGQGLGLWIVERIVRRLGGTAGVESDGATGRGCRFYFTLPAAADGRGAARER